jgi:hypothetical protein
VRLPSSGMSFQGQVLCGFSQSIHRSGSRPVILNGVVSLTLLAIGIQSPTFWLLALGQDPLWAGLPATDYKHVAR